MARDDSRTLTPELRFPEFREPWKAVPLSDLAESISERVGTEPCVPYTVTSGVGLISQDEKLGRTIAGKSLKNYIRLKKHDFAYNKSATKAFPEGYIARYLDDANAAVPNSIFTCFRADTPCRLARNVDHYQQREHGIPGDVAGESCPGYRYH